MPSDSETLSTAGIVKATIDLRRLAWVRPLVAAYEAEFETVASFFAGDPRHDEVWRETIARVSRAPRDRERLTALVGAQLDRRGAPVDARRNAARLADPASVAVVTGQQAGLFGGPLYTLLKAITAVQLARRVAARWDTVTVPVFWIAGEDHDWAEIRSTAVLDAEQSVRDITAADVPGAGALPVASLSFDESIGRVLDELRSALPVTEFTAELVAGLQRHYRAGSNPAAALAGLLDELLGSHGLVVFDGSDQALKPLVGDLFVAELQDPEGTAHRVRAAGEALQARGHDPQIVPADHATGLFYLDDSGREPIRFQDGQFGVGSRMRTRDDLVAEASVDPSRFSPNVMLRPIVQDRLFPNICYVAGPSELAYQAQLAEVYAAFGIERPLFCSRTSATLLDSAASRFLERYDVPFEALAARDDSALNRLLEQHLPASVTQAVEETERLLDSRWPILKSAVGVVDPTLTGAVETTASRMRDALGNLQRKIIQAAKRRDDTLRRQFARTRALTFPDGQPQERRLGLVNFLNRYGPTLADRLLDGVPIDGGRHFLVEP